MDRRKFIKSSCTLCFAGIGLASLVSSCSPLPVYKSENTNGKLIIPLTNFVTVNAIITRTSKLPFDILVRKVSETKYTALYLQCTHEDQPLTATNSQIVCSSHGSTFDLEGNVTKEPALKALKKFNTELSADGASLILTI